MAESRYRPIPSEEAHLPYDLPVYVEQLARWPVVLLGQRSIGRGMNGSDRQTCAELVFAIHGRIATASEIMRGDGVSRGL